MGINRLFEISRASFRTLDAAMNVASQNIANVETDGYSRRRVTLNAVDVVSRGITTNGAGISPSGAGVTVATYDRLRDSLLDHARWEARGGLANADEQQRVLGTMEALFPVGAGSLQEVLESFWNGWSDLSDHPTDAGVRLTLRARAQNLTGRFNELAGQLSRMREDTTAALSGSVTDANALIAQIGELNVSIARARNAGSPDFASEDARDQSIQQLAELIPLQVREPGDGTSSVYLDGMALVQGPETVSLTLDTSGSTPTVTIGNAAVPFIADDNSGRIGAMLGGLSGVVSNTETALDSLVNTLVAQVNTLHSAGFGQDGLGSRDFFDPATATAGGMRLSTDVLASATAIAASGDVDATGDNTTALAILDLRDTALMNGGTQTLGDYAIDLGSGIGSQIAAARARAEGSEAVVANLDAMAEGVSGVSLDEEMVSLIQLQQAFAASARVLQTAQDMFDTLLSL